jgi:2-aminoadipate transaminase
LRLGYAIADERMIRALTIGKQAADLHSGQLSQIATARLLQTFDYDAHLAKLCAVYGERCDAMLAAVERCFPQGTTWTQPEGGLFVWAQLPGEVDAQELLRAAMLEKVAFVPGAPFYPRDPLRSTLRLNFSNRPSELIAQGIARLGNCVERFLAGDAAA